MARIEITVPGERVVEEFTTLVKRPVTPSGATPAGIGLVEISQSTPTELIPGPVGPQGPRGSRWYTGTGDPTVTGALLGDMYLDDTTGAVWAWDGTQWVDTGTNIQGDDSTVPGPQGEQGEQGEQGIQGVSGPQGIQGPQGVKGDTGSQGPQGPQGATGADSTVPGPPGATGSTGATGPGVAPGGTAGQVLTKINATDYNTNWQTPSAGGGASVTIADTAPGGATAGDMWWESDSGALHVFFDSAWIQVASATSMGTLGTAATKNIHVGITAPSSPATNDLWVDTT